MSVHHHPGEELLVAYAAGSLAEGLSVLIATHLALCPDCRRDVAQLEEVGGALIEDTVPTDLDGAALDRTLARLDEPAPAPSTAGSRPSTAADSASLLLPEPLRGYLGTTDLESLTWRRFGRGYRQHELLRDGSGQVVHLLGIAPGTAMPHHGHGGEELTMVLQGGFSDETGHYLRGDVATMDESATHQPVADPGEQCLCIAVSSTPVQLTGLLGRLLQPFLRL